MPLSSDESRLRDYKLRKVSKLVRRCRTKNIKFDKKYVDLSYELTTNPETMTMADMEALRVECTEGLGSDYCSMDSDSDNEIKRQMRRKKEAWPSHCRLQSVQPVQQKLRCGKQ